MVITSHVVYHKFLSLGRPIFFLAFLSPLGNTIRKYDLDFHFDADDSRTRLSFEFGDWFKQEIAVETVNCIRSWMSANIMTMNDTELAAFGTWQQLTNLRVHLLLNLAMN